MYCRKCGEQISDKAKFCDSCGESIVLVKQRDDAEKVRDKAKNSKKKTKHKEEKTETLNNPYVSPAIGSAVLAFILGIFPWPADWEIGTSLWMRILILVLALLGSYHSTKARQMNRLFDIKHHQEVQPKAVKVATGLSSVTLVVALFALFMM